MAAPVPTRPRRPLPMLSPSRLDLADECLYPWTSGIDWPRDDSSDAAVFGSAVHAGAEWIAAAPLEAPRNPDEIALAAALTAAHYDLTAGNARKLRDRLDVIAEKLEGETVDWRVGERRIAYDPQSGKARELADGEERRGGELVLVIDLLQEAGGEWVVRDWKTGRRPAIRRVQDSMQIQAYALGVYKIYGFGQLRVELCWLSDRGIWTDSSTFDAFDFDAIEVRLRRLDNDRRRGGHEPHLGLHCVEHFCPIRGLCPMALAAAESVYAAAELRHPLVTDEAAIAGPLHARELLERLPLAYAALERAEAALKEYVTHKGAIDLGGGKAWGAVEKPGNESIEATDAAQAVIIEALGEHAAEAIETKTETSKSAIDRAIRKACEGAKRGAQKRMREPLLAKLRTVGAIRRGAPWTSFEAFKREA